VGYWSRSPLGHQLTISPRLLVDRGDLSFCGSSVTSRCGRNTVTSNLSHPGVAPTSLLAARPEIGRSHDTTGVRVIRTLSACGILLGTVETAKLPALLAATDPDAEPGTLYGPSGPGNLGGPPAEQRLYPPLRSSDDAARIWRVSEELTKTSFPTA